MALTFDPPRPTNKPTQHKVHYIPTISQNLIISLSLLGPRSYHWRSETMAPISSFFVLILSFPLLALSFPAPSPLIQRTCNITTYYNLCVTTLQSDPRSLKADDEKALLTIIISIAITDATNMSSYVSSLTQKKTEATLKSILRACAGMYGNAGEALRSAVDALAHENYDYAYVHVSAARDYPSSCGRLFRMNPRLKYPPKMARREEGLEQFCTMALDIVSLLG